MSEDLQAFFIALIVIILITSIITFFVLPPKASFHPRSRFYGQVPLSTLPNGIAMTGSGDAMLGSSASFCAEEPEMKQTSNFITPTQADAQLTYGTFVDGEQYESFADTVDTKIVMEDRLPYGWGKCSDKIDDTPPAVGSDEYIAQKWSSRLL